MWTPGEVLSLTSCMRLMTRSKGLVATPTVCVDETLDRREGGVCGSGVSEASSSRGLAGVTGGGGAEEAGVTNAGDCKGERTCIVATDSMVDVCEMGMPGSDRVSLKPSVSSSTTVQSSPLSAVRRPLASCLRETSFRRKRWPSFGLPWSLVSRSVMFLSMLQILLPEKRLAWSELTGGMRRVSSVAV